MHTSIDTLKGEAIELLQQLIRNQCVNDGRPESGNEQVSAPLLRDEMEGLGLDHELIETEPGRTSLVARYVADEEAGGVLGAAPIIEHQWDRVKCDYVLTEYGGMPSVKDGATTVLLTTGEKHSAGRLLVVHGTPGHGSTMRSPNSRLTLHATCTLAAMPRTARTSCGRAANQTRCLTLRNSSSTSVCCLVKPKTMPMPTFVQ